MKNSQIERCAHLRACSQETEKERVSDWPQRSRQRCAQHVNTNTKSLKGFHPGEISARLRSQHSLQRQRENGLGEGEAKHIKYLHLPELIMQSSHIFTSFHQRFSVTSNVTVALHFSFTFIFLASFLHIQTMPQLSLSQSLLPLFLSAEKSLPSHPSPGVQPQQHQ